MASNPVNERGVFVHENTSAPEHPSLMQMFSLKGKTAIVTGAAAGIGLAVAQGLAEAGANVALWWGANSSCPERAAEIAAKYGIQCEYSSELALVPFRLDVKKWKSNFHSQGLPGRCYKPQGCPGGC